MTVRQQLGVVLGVVVCGIVVIAVGERTVGRELHPIGVGVTAPNFTAQTLGAPAHTKTLADYTGQVVLLNTWATWCAPCRAEMPAIEQLYRTFAPRGLKVVAVSVDEPGAETGIQAFAEQFGLTFDVLHDPTGAIEHSYQMTGLPESFLIGRDGVIRKKVAGAVDWDSDGNRRLVARLLAE